MKDQINTIRSELTSLHGIVGDLSEALAALDQIEAAVGEQEPVAWIDGGDLELMRKHGRGCIAWAQEQNNAKTPLYAAPPAQQYEAGDVASASAQGFRDGVASVAQQPQARPDFTDEWTGYLKDGETPFERFLRERKDMQSVLKLYQRVLEENEQLKAQQPQAEPHKCCANCAEHGECRPNNIRGCGYDPDDACNKQPQAETYEQLVDALHRIDSAAVFLPHFQVRHEGGIEAVTQNIVEAIAAACKQPQAEAVPTDTERAYLIGFADGKQAQQSEAVPSDVVRDAERYRWLRDRATVSHQQRATSKGVDYPTTWHIVTGGSDTSIDAAIDAAIAQQKGGV